MRRLNESESDRPGGAQEAETVGCTSVGGIPLTDLMKAETIQAIVKRTRDAGTEIVEYLKTGSAYYAPSAAERQEAGAALLQLP